MANNDFLVYPDLQQFLEDAPNLLVSINRYKEEIERYLSFLNYLKNPEEDNEYLKSLQFLDVFKKFKNMSKKNQEKSIILYNKFLRLLKKYQSAYNDTIARETPGEEAKISPFFKSLPDIIAEACPHISFAFTSREKSWVHFIQKAMTLLEADAENLGTKNELNVKEYNFKIDSFYDIHACKAKVQSEKIRDIKNQVDYERAHQDCYDIMNTFITIVLKKGAKLLKPNWSGQTSELILPEYRGFIKDYILNPKPNGYMALHCCMEIELSDELIEFEFQAKSKFMEHFSKNGSVWCHKKHKQNSKLEMDVDFTQISYPDFSCSVENGVLIMDDDCGLEVGKEITKRRIYQRRI